MQLWNVPASIVNAIVVRVSQDRYAGNVIFNRDPEPRGRAVCFTLRTKSAFGPGARRASRGRHLVSACWHVHLDVMQAIFNHTPEARLKTALADYRGAADFDAKFRATANSDRWGSVSATDLCSCPPDKPTDDLRATAPPIQFITLVQGPGGVVGASVHTLKQASVARCPHFILLPEHYRADESCYCDDPTHVEMKEWGYRWNKKTERWAA